MRRISRGLKLVCVLFGLFTDSPLRAQAPTATLIGIVRDSGGGSVAGADLHALDLATRHSYVTSTGQSGQYWLGGLPPGRYDVTVRAIGYVPVRRRAVDLVVGATVSLEFVLVPGAVNLDPIEVIAESPLIETSEPGVTFALDRQQIARIPEESRRLLDLALLAPGTTATPDNHEPVAPVQIGGLSSYSAGVIVDGGQLIHGGNHGLAGNLPLLAVQEFEVLTTSYSAEFGQAASGLVNAVTRRGSNELSGEGFALYRHRSLNTLGAFETTKPDYSRVHWGAAVGGPIVHDRTHFFAAVEHRAEDAFAVVETGDAFANLEGAFLAPFDDVLVFTRLDHRLSSRHELMARYAGEFSQRRSDIGSASSCAFPFGGGTLTSAAFSADTDQDFHSLLARHRWTISPRLLNEATVHFTDTRELRSPRTGGAAYKYPTICTGGNHLQWDSEEWRLEIAEKLSAQVGGRSGTHRLSIGARVSLTGRDREVATLGTGIFQFSTDTSAQPVMFRRFLDVPVGDAQHNVQLGFYAQDNWSLSRGLTLTAGLRYDVETNGTNQDFVAPAAADLPFLSTRPRGVDGNNLAPRVGFAWDPFGRGTTVLRGGFGIFYDQLSSWWGGLETSPTRVQTVFNPGTTDPRHIPTDAGASPLVMTVMDPVMETPSTHQYSLGVEQVLSRNSIVRLDGVIVRGRNLILGHQRNPFVSPTENVRKYPAYGAVLVLRSLAEADAKMLMARVRHTWARGNLDLSYTLADRKATVDRWFDYVFLVPDTSSDFSSEYGPAAWDERHRVVLFGNVALPFGLDAALKSIYSSARPYTAIEGTDVNGDRILNDRPPGDGRNAWRGPDFFRVDVGLGWSVPVGGARLRVQANVYNLLNRTNLNPSSVVNTLSSPLFGAAVTALTRRQVEIGTQLAF